MRTRTRLVWRAITCFAPALLFLGLTLQWAGLPPFAVSSSSPSTRLSHAQISDPIDTRISNHINQVCYIVLGMALVVISTQIGAYLFHLKRGAPAKPLQRK